MNKIVNINLGGYSFTIDEDAYVKLKNYLNTLKTHFQTSEGSDEIMYDIEVRLAELFSENMAGQEIVNNKNLNDAISIMGTPADFGAAMEDEVPVQTSTSRKSGKRRAVSGRRLFRDPDNKVIGGVCSGLSAYFGIADPLWLRIAALILIFTGGLSIIPYIILMIIVPEATSSADKLAMKGEPINIDTIAKTVKTEVDDLVDRGTETINSTFSSKKKPMKDHLGFAQVYPKGFLF